MSRQAFLSMPLSFAIVLVAGVALSGADRQDDDGLQADPLEETAPVALPEAFEQPEPPAPVAPADEPAPESPSIEPHGEIEPQERVGLLEEIEPQQIEPDLEAEPIGHLEKTTEEDRSSEAPSTSTTGRGRELWRPIAPSPSNPRP